MAVIHRALFTWFNLLIFLVLMVLRLDLRILWNWFIVFMPMWLYDSMLLIYIIFNMISHCKNGHDRINSVRKMGWYMTAVLLKMSTQILICSVLEAPQWNLPSKIVLLPLWILLPVLSTDVFIHLIQHSRY
ncbi:hypothetical protein HCN44_000359 [Aphidius gifuensis]|uniref:Transmembrane protein 60 n=1 Tax=Aphidius gifuensis TaxID=684658 RepID=A0A835CN80_APHGI|nr:transmembrane protein 60 [Aphidius gifuensis]KAF7990554.1 hypothetical protein HCN44_000359 [Aphidius gifuensis]